MVTTQRRVYNVSDGAEYIGIGRSKFLELAYKGEINSFTVGRRRLFLVEDLDDFLDRMRQQADGAQRERA